MTGRSWIAVGVAGLGLALVLALLSAAPAGAASADEPTTGTITIVLDAAPNDAQDFAFTGCQGPWCGPFTLDDDANATLANSVTANDLAPGTYTITQDAVPNWALSSLTCDTGETIDLANRRATIDLTAGEHATCTFTNTSASITIVESSYVADTHDFTYTGCLGSGCANFNLDDDDGADPTLPDGTAAAGLAPGTYTITQAADTNWKLTSISCTTGESVSLANRRVTITLTAGEQQTCTFSNRPPSIAISSTTSPNDPQSFGFTGCLGSGCADFTLDRDPATTPTASHRADVLAVGTYVITQAPNANWPLTEIDCDSAESVDLANRRVTITLTAGERQICEFVNTSASLTLVEDTAPDGPQDFTFQRCAGQDCAEVVLDDDLHGDHSNSAGPMPLPPGTYTVSVDPTAGDELASVTCPGESLAIDDRRVTITLTANEQQRCTFTHRPPQPPLTGVTQLSTGLATTCARLISGQARCWGYDAEGQLGDGRSGSQLGNPVAQSVVPATVLRPDAGGPLGDVSSVSAGFSHICASLASGEARCWGQGGAGELGNGTTTLEQSLPVVVSNGAGTGPLTGVTSVAAGGSHSCGLLTTSEVRCWGRNTNGEVGDGTNSLRSRPVTVLSPAGSTPLTGARQITAGLSHTCALVSPGGEARCWGANTRGALGDGTTTSRTRPVEVSNSAGDAPLTGITQIAAGSSHTCALVDDGRAWCWGDNRYGQLGDGSTTDRVRPVVVSSPDGSGPLTGITQIATGYDVTCAVTGDSDTRVYCWGIGGALGDGTTSSRSRPALVSNPDGSGPLTGATQVSVGRVGCAVLTSGQVHCWGDNRVGSLGDGTIMARTRPVPVIDPSAALQALRGIAQLSTGGRTSCAVLLSSEVRCWGGGALGNPDVASSPFAVPVVDTDGVGALSGVAQLSAGTDHVCAVMIDTSAVCWGDNWAGQLGDGTETSRTVPTPVRNEDGTALLIGIAQIDAGDDQTCATLTTGQARCWGDRYLGNGSAARQSLPVVVNDVGGAGPLTDVVQVSSGDGGACATLTTGQARCWGLEPTVVLNAAGTGPLTDVAAVESAYDKTCFVLDDGQARCRGTYPGDGTELGGSRLATVLNPAGTAPETDIASIRQTEAHVCATLTTGQSRCWGPSNQFGQLGASPPSGAGSLLPVAVVDPAEGGPITTAAEVTTGILHTCARLLDGQARCWGLNSWGTSNAPGWGTLGDGTYAYARYHPVPVVEPIGP